MTDPRHSPLDTAAIRRWWDDLFDTVNAPTPHWMIPALCDEVDRLRTENERLTAENTALMGDARL